MHDSYIYMYLLCSLSFFSFLQIAFWNHGKGMTDVFSRCMKNAMPNFQSLHPSAFIWIRLIMTMVWDTHLLRQLFHIERKLDSFISLDQLRNSLNKEASFADSILYCAHEFSVLEAQMVPAIPASETPGETTEAPVVFKGTLKDSSKNVTKVNWLNSDEGKAVRAAGHHSLDVLPSNAERQCLYCSKKTRHHCKQCHKATGGSKVFFPICSTPCYTTNEMRCIKTCDELIHSSSGTIVPDATRKKKQSEGKQLAAIENQLLAVTARKRKRSRSPSRSPSPSTTSTSRASTSHRRLFADEEASQMVEV
jgi:hypothetical protein